MAKQLKIYTIEDPKEEKILRKISTDIAMEDIKTEEFQTFISNLLNTALNSEKQGNVAAGGIAAAQVGKNIRVFYALNYDTDEWQVFINPEVSPIGFQKTSTMEGCLSIPNIEGEVLRYRRIKVRYLDEKGEKRNEKYEGFNAITIQHELDHLNGILFTDRLE